MSLSLVIDGVFSQRSFRIKQRFKELGYKDSDLEFLRWNSACTRRAELTDQGMRD